MFNVLNKFISQLDAGSAPQPPTQSNADNSYGFQVLRNEDKDLPIEPWFDFIIGINGHFIVRVKDLMLQDQPLNRSRKTPIQISLQQRSATAPVHLSRWTSGVQKYFRLRHLEDLANH